MSVYTIILPVPIASNVRWQRISVDTENGWAS